MAQVGVAWSLANDFVTAPIVGSTSLENLKELIAGVHVTLTPEEKKYIDEPYTPRAIVSDRHTWLGDGGNPLCKDKQRQAS